MERQTQPRTALRALQTLLLLAVLATLVACATPSTTTGSSGAVQLQLSCPRDARAGTAAYVGPYKGVENVVPLKELAQDMHCSESFKQARFPQGYVTVYGGSRIKEKNDRCDATGCDNRVADANDKLYADVYAFARLWTQRHGKRYAIMTGGGLGLMLAANRGAKEVGGDSIGYTTYYDPTDRGTPTVPYGGDPSEALNPFVTEGLIFTSIAARESVMFKHSAAIVLTPGGTGTEWEVFQIAETIKSKQLTKVPIYLFGDRAHHWASLDQRLQDLVKRRMVNEQELAFLKYVDSPAQLVELLSRDLGVR